MEWNSLIRSVFTNNRIVYVENPSESTKDFLETQSELSKIVGFKIKKKKNLYASNNHLEIAMK